MRKLIFTVLRTAIGLLLAIALVYLTLKTTETNLWHVLRDADKGLLAAAVLAHGVVIAVSAWRWLILLRMQDIPLRGRDACRLTMIGFFFNLAVPGAVGGDVVKMAYVARQAPGKRTEAIFSVMVDRVVGILGLFAVASVAVFFALPVLLRLEAAYRPVQVAAFTVGLGSLGGVIGILGVEFHEALLKIPGVQACLDFAGRRLPDVVTEHVLRLMDALDQYRRNRRAVAGCILMSVMIHTGLAFTLILVGRSLHEDTVSPGAYFLTAQVANAIAAIPVTPAGVGPRDYVARTFFEAWRMDPHVMGAIPVSFTLIIIFWGLVGAVVFIAAPVSKDTLRRFPAP